MMNEIKVMGDRVFKLTGECDPKKCKAWCCQHCVFVIDKVNKDDNTYFNLHKNIDAIQRGKNKFAVLVKSTCIHMSTKSGKCMIYEIRPESCRNYACNPAMDHFWSQDCTLIWKELRGRQKQVALSKLRKGEDV